jgi:Mce-associated membrane protein
VDERKERLIERMSRVTSEARARALAEDDTVLGTDAAAERPHDEPTEEAAPRAEKDDATDPDTPADAVEEEPEKPRRGLRHRRAAAADDEEPEPADEADEDDDRAPRRRSGGAGPLATGLAVLLVLLLAGGAWLWFSRPKTSSVSSHDYVAVLQAARSEIVDLTSFDYLTLDDDIAQAKRITTGDLQKEVVAQLNKTRADVTSAEAVVSTEVIGAAVTKADDEHGTVVLFIQSTQKNNQVAQAQVLQYQVEANLTKVGDRWLLSGIQGQG